MIEGEGRGEEETFRLRQVIKKLLNGGCLGRLLNASAAEPISRAKA